MGAPPSWTNSVFQPDAASGAGTFFKRISVFPPLLGLPLTATALIIPHANPKKQSLQVYCFYPAEIEAPGFRITIVRGGATLIRSTANRVHACDFE
jgi:hypothetical protein